MTVAKQVELIRAAAAAIANARGKRRGVPYIENVLELLPADLRSEVMEEATAALEAVLPLLGGFFDADPC